MNKFAVTMSNAVRLLLLPALGGLGGTAAGGLGDYLYQKAYQSFNPQMNVDPVEILNAMITGGLMGAGAGVGAWLTTGEFSQLAQSLFKNPNMTRNLAMGAGAALGLGASLPLDYATNSAAMTHADNEMKIRTMRMLDNAMQQRRDIPQSLQPALPYTFPPMMPQNNMNMMPSVMPSLQQNQGGGMDPRMLQQLMLMQQMSQGQRPY